MTYEEALAKANEAKGALEKAKTPEDVKNIVIQFGQKGIGYSPLCKYIFANQPAEKALKVYNR